MPNIIYKYINAEGEEILVKGESLRENTRGGRDAKETIIKRVQVKFEEALGTVKAASKGLKKVVDEVNPDEVSIEFSLKAEGETGFFTIVRAATGAEFKITLTWKNEKPKI